MKIKQVLQNIKFINDIYTRYKWRERKLSKGTENTDKDFYVVRRANAKVGLFSLVLTNIGYIKYAVENGYIPIVDMSNYCGFYDGYEENKTNMWEYYFKQPCGYTLEKVAHSKNVILGNGIISKDVEYPADEIAYDETKLIYWKNVAKQYLKVNDNIEQEAERLQKKIFGSDKVLGVLARGTDYINAKPLNHPVQPMPEQLMEKIDEVMGTQKCDKIYLATEDKVIYSLFQEKYGDKLLSLDVERFETEGNENINEVRKSQKKNGYISGKEYLLTILLLAKCNCLVAGNTSGSLGALLLNDEYEYKYIFDLGVYGKNGENG